MGSGLLQLVATGAQDTLLTSNPQVTLFRSAYKRITNFANESIPQTMNGTVRGGAKTSVVISRNGDLVSDMWLQIKMKRHTSGTPFYPAEEILKSVSVEIGGQLCDRHYPTWYRLFDNIYRNSTERDAYKSMTNFVDSEIAGTVKTFHLPLLFWFNRNISSALALVALQFHEVRLTFEWADAVAGVDLNNDFSAELWCDYTYLDVDERRKFASEAAETLVEVVQFTGDENVVVSNAKAASQQVRLSFNHPVKHLLFAVADPAVHGKFTGKAAGDTAEATAPLKSARLLLNGHERQAERIGSYYNKVVPYQTAKVSPDAGIYQFTFGVRPTELAPSGTLNMSRIDSAVLALTFKQADPNLANVDANDILAPTENATAGATALTALRVFAVSVNWLRVQSGMGGLAFSN